MRSALKFSALSALMLLAGCAATPAIESGTVKTNTVDMVRISFDATFAPGALKLAPGEQARLDEFMRQTAIGNTDEISIDTGSGPFAAQRQTALHTYFGRSGASMLVQPIAYGDPVGVNGLRIVVTRFRVTPPADCPDWSKSSFYDFHNTVHSNFGCATTVNLGAQIANPRDLLTGQTYRPHDSSVSARAVDAYHTGTQKTPEKITTSSSGN